MVKPIPIFEYAFAAYAATARTGADWPVAAPKRRSFEAALRSLASRDGALLVKIGVLDNGHATAALAPCESMLRVNEIWLGQVRETADGYSGVVCVTQTPLRSLGSGQRIVFGASHIVDWTITHETPARCAVLRERVKPALPACQPCGDCAFVDEARG